MNNVTETLRQGELLLAAQRPAEAASCFSRAERMGADPDYCAGRRWTCYMLHGDYELAWQQSDSIRARGAEDPHRVWDGSSLADKAVLIRSVHGFGDAIQMLRYAPVIRPDVSRLTLQVAPELIDLVGCAPGLDEVIRWGEERAFDVQVEITELPYILRSTLTTLPNATPYIQLPAELIAEARLLLGVHTKRRIGLVWSSSAWDSTRSIPFEMLQPIFEAAAEDDIELWCLQPGAPEWIEFRRQRGLPANHAGNYPALFFAACISQMDLVITTDSFAAHLAGALAVSTWVMLKQTADWRWMVERGDSPWYPTLRLFRQREDGDWQPVVAGVAQHLPLVRALPINSLAAAR